MEQLRQTWDFSFPLHLPATPLQKVQPGVSKEHECVSLPSLTSEKPSPSPISQHVYTEAARGQISSWNHIPLGSGIDFGNTQKYLWESGTLSLGFHLGHKGPDPTQSFCNIPKPNPSQTQTKTNSDGESVCGRGPVSVNITHLQQQPEPKRAVG